jgi:hypothetical protein
MTPTRRHLLGATAILPLALAACQGQTASQLQSDVTALSTGLSGVVAALQAVPGVAASVIAQAQTAIATIQANASAIASALTPSATTVQSISSAVTALSGLLTPFFPGAPAIAAVIQAAVAIVPVILSEAGVSGAVAGAGVGMSAAQARAILAVGVK